MALTKLERETGVLWNEAESEALIWSASLAVQRRFTKQFGPGMRSGPDTLEWIVPLGLLTVRKRALRTVKPMTEAQRRALASGRKRD